MSKKSVVDLEKLCASYCGAGRVEQELHAAETVDGKLDHIVNGGAFGDIDGECQRLTADGVNFLGGLFHARLVDVGTNDVRLLTSKNKCGRAADPAGCAGNDDGLASEIVR